MPFNDLTDLKSYYASCINKKLGRVKEDIPITENASDSEVSEETNIEIMEKDLILLGIESQTSPNNSKPECA